MSKEIELSDKSKNYLINIVFAKKMAQIEELVENEKLRPMITDGLYNMGYYKHLSNKTVIHDTEMIFDNIPDETEVDNSCMAKDIIYILKQLIKIIESELDCEITKKYKHVKSKDN